MDQQRFEAMVETGKRNVEAMDLAQNWCAHLKIVRDSGGGLFEAQTGLPIGLQHIECNFAPIGGISAHEFRDAALYFHDANCIECKHRRPKGFPNLSRLLKERSAAQATQAAEQARIDRSAAQAAADRQRVRERLRPCLGTLAATILDDIGTYDQDRSPENLRRLESSATLAPEHFTPPLVTYLFDLSETELWFADTGIFVLSRLGHHPARLCRLAARTLQTARSAAALRAVVDHIEELAPESAKALIPFAATLAYPEYHGVGHEIEADPTLLRALWQHNRTEVLASLDELLSSRKVRGVELAARGYSLLATWDRTATTIASRNLVSTYVRAHLLIDDIDWVRPGLPGLAEALALTFDLEPVSLDHIVQDFTTGSDAQSRARAPEIYVKYLTWRRQGGQRPIETAANSGDRIAFRRLLWAPTINRDDTVLSAVQEVFRGDPGELAPLARLEIDSLLGAALILDQHLEVLVQAAQPGNETFFEALEKSNRRSAFNSLVSSYIKWAASAAAEDEIQIGRMVDTFDQIPEGHERLKGQTLRALGHLATSSTGLRRMLPSLYAGLVGASARLRIDAAEALGEIPTRGRKNLPPLVFEAFVVLLKDPIRGVHQTALRTLSRINLPPELRTRAAHAIVNLLFAYHGEADQDVFIVDCLEQLSERIDEFDQVRPALLTKLVDIAMRIEPIYILREIRFLAHTLGECEAFADLVIRLLPHIDRWNTRDKLSWELLRCISDAGVLSRQDKLVAFGVKILNDAPWYSFEIVERLTQAGATEAAQRLAAAIQDTLPEGERYGRIRLHGELISVAHAFEQAVGAGDRARQGELASKGRELLTSRSDMEAEARDCRSRAGFPFPG